MKQMEVHIMQQSYMLGCPEGQEERLQTAVKHVDAAMCGIRDTGKIRGREKIAVLAALNIAFDLLESQAATAAAEAAAAEAAAAPQPAPAPEPVAQATLDLDEPRMQALLERLDSALK
ncbi:MAG: cell division protein ZapA [Comamonas sp.]